MNISVNIKNGTGGWADYDSCDFCVTKITHENFPIPRIGETLALLEDNDKGNVNSKGETLKEYHEYLVTDVRYWIGNNNYGVTVYVLPIGRSVET